MDLDPILQVLSGSKVDVHVGPNRVHFQLPKDILCRQFSYFDKALNGDFREGEEQRLELPDEDVKTFRELLKWMLTGRLDAISTELVMEDSDDDTDPGDSESNDRANNKLNRSEVQYQTKLNMHMSIGRTFKLYVFADKLCMTPLKNAILNKIALYYEIEARLISSGKAQWVFQRTTPSSPLRKITLKIIAYAILSQEIGRSGIKNYLDGTDDLACELVAVMAECAQKMRDVRRWRLGGGCTFHDHADGKPCGDLRVSGGDFEYSTILIPSKRKRDP
ncbi:MAG: hypothetical protein M1835_002816 [Candelina submexicana]|nr:MAG: hypothetical protein M1835_002816 [Candelina submexicana]